MGCTQSNSTKNAQADTEQMPAPRIEESPSKANLSEEDKSMATIDVTDTSTIEKGEEIPTSKTAGENSAVEAAKSIPEAQSKTVDAVIMPLSGQDSANSSSDQKSQVPAETKDAKVAAEQASVQKTAQPESTVATKQTAQPAAPTKQEAPQPAAAAKEEERNSTSQEEGSLETKSTSPSATSKRPSQSSRRPSEQAILLRISSKASLKEDCDSSTLQTDDLPVASSEDWQVSNILQQVREDPPMRLLTLPQFKTFGKIPKSSEIGTSFTTPFKLQEENKRESSFIVLVSHRWYQITEPDVSNIKFGLLCKGLDQIQEKVGPAKVLVWVDYYGIDQENEELMKQAALCLLDYISSSDALLTPFTDSVNPPSPTQEQEEKRKQMQAELQGIESEIQTEQPESQAKGMPVLEETAQEENQDNALEEVQPSDEVQSPEVASTNTATAKKGGMFGFGKSKKDDKKANPAPAPAPVPAPPKSAAQGTATGASKAAPKEPVQQSGYTGKFDDLWPGNWHKQFRSLSNAPSEYLGRSWCRVELYLGAVLELSDGGFNYFKHIEDTKRTGRPHFFIGDYPSNESRQLQTLPELKSSWLDELDAMNAAVTNVDRDWILLRTIMDDAPQKEGYEGATNSDDKPHGQGKYYAEDGSRYDGEWVNGAMDGRGKATFPDGGSYNGQWKDGKMHGSGIFDFANGSRYEGHWSEGNMNGKGHFRFANGDVYQGDFVNDQRHGKGKCVYPAHPNDAIYDGDWKDDKKHGRGCYTYPNGDKYEGDYFEGYLHGTGTFTYSSGSNTETQRWERGQKVA